MRTIYLVSLKPEHRFKTDKYTTINTAISSILLIQSINLVFPLSWASVENVLNNFETYIPFYSSCMNIKCIQAPKADRIRPEGN